MIKKFIYYAEMARCSSKRETMEPRVNVVDDFVIQSL